MFFQTFDNGFHALGPSTVRFYHQHNNICVCGPTPSRFDHCAVKAPARFEQAGGVDENQLRIPFDGDATNAGAGGLHLMGHDRHFCADHFVQQRRLARVGLANQGHKACFGGRVSHDCSTFCNNAAAAACSAWRLEPAVACSDGPEAKRTSMVKIGW